MGQVFKKHAVDGLVHRVEEHGLLVEQEIGVIGNAVGHAVDALKEGETPVVRADPDQVVQNLSCAVHREFSFVSVIGTRLYIIRGKPLSRKSKNHIRQGLRMKIGRTTVVCCNT